MSLAVTELVFFVVTRDGAVQAVQREAAILQDDSFSGTLNLVGAQTDDGSGAPSGVPVPGPVFDYFELVPVLDGLARSALMPSRTAAMASLLSGSGSGGVTLHLVFNGASLPAAGTTVAVHLRALSSIDWLFVEGGRTAAQSFPAIVGRGSSDSYTLDISVTLAGALTGASLSNSASDPDSLALRVGSAPEAAWDMNDLPFTLALTTRRMNGGTLVSSWTSTFDGRQPAPALDDETATTAFAAARPSVTLRRLRYGGAPVAGLLWIRSRAEGMTSTEPMCASLPAGTTAIGTLLDASLAGGTLTLDDELRLTPNPSERAALAYDAASRDNRLAITLRTAGGARPDAFLDDAAGGGAGSGVPLRLRRMSVDDETAYRRELPYDVASTFASEGNRRLQVEAGDAYEWELLAEELPASVLALDASSPAGAAALLAWGEGQLAGGDAGFLRLAATPTEAGWPACSFELNVSVGATPGAIDVEVVGAGEVHTLPVAIAGESWEAMLEAQTSELGAGEVLAWEITVQPAPEAPLVLDAASSTSSIANRMSAGAIPAWGSDQTVGVRVFRRDAGGRLLAGGASVMLALPYQAMVVGDAGVMPADDAAVGVDGSVRADSGAAAGSPGGGCACAVGAPLGAGKLPLLVLPLLAVIARRRARGVRPTRDAGHVVWVAASLAGVASAVALLTS